MIANDLKIALRNLRRHKAYTSINLGGLALGFGASLLFLLLAWKLLSWDAFHAHADDTYLVLHEHQTTAGIQRNRTTWAPLLPALQRTYSAIVTGTRVEEVGHHVRVGGRVFDEQVHYVDSTFFDVFSFPLRRGDPASVLDLPHAAVLTELAAQRFFGDADPIGKELVLDGRSTLVVAGIAENPPGNTSVSFEIVAPLRHAIEHVDRIRQHQARWASMFLSTYIRLADGADPAQLEAQIPSLLAPRIGAEAAADHRMRLVALPDAINAFAPINRFAYILIAMALGILGMASMNVTNLATARSLERAREVGVRKVMGAGHWQIASQFLTEATLLALTALLVGIVLAHGFLPTFRQLIELPLSIDLGAPAMWGALLVLGIGVGLSAGGYPAFVLARFQPAWALRYAQAPTARRRLRTGLVVMQFALAVALIAGTFGLRKQMGYLEERIRHALPLDDVVVMPIDGAASEEGGSGGHRLHTFRAEALRHRAIRRATVTSAVPGAYHSTQPFSATPDAAETIQMHTVYADAQYAQTFGLRSVAGHGFDTATEAERRTGVVLNERAMDMLGWSSIEGKQLYQGNEALPVIGVVANYPYAPLNASIGPVVHRVAAPDFVGSRYIAVHLVEGSAQAALDHLRAQWTQQFGASRVLDYFFAADRFDGISTLDAKLALLLQYAALLAIGIALMGLIGIASLTVVQRTKEVGIRKALGATAASIAALLVRDVARPVLVAIAIALPLSYWALTTYLQAFAYRVTLGVMPFLGAGGAVLGMALVAVGYHTLRAARSDPAKSLQCE